MFFKTKKEAIKPTKEQVELYGNHIYAILVNSGDITPFDKLVCDAFTYFWMIEKSRQSKFLVANPVAKIDAIIATAYINSLIFFSQSVLLSPESIIIVLLSGNSIIIQSPCPTSKK